MDELDTLLRRLRTQSPDRRLDRLEADVWSRIEARKTDIFGGKTWQVQLAVTCGSLLLGVFIAQSAGMSSMMPEPLSSEIVVLSDDSQVAPSVILEGGI